MWDLLQDFLEQPLLMKAYIGWGWLSVLIMVLSMSTTVPPVIKSMMPEPATSENAAH